MQNWGFLFLPPFPNYFWFFVVAFFKVLTSMSLLALRENHVKLILIQSLTSFPTLLSCIELKVLASMSLSTLRLKHIESNQVLLDHFWSLPNFYCVRYSKFSIPPPCHCHSTRFPPLHCHSKKIPSFCPAFITLPNCCIFFQFIITLVRYIHYLKQLTE